MTAPKLKPCPFCGEKCRVQQNGWTSSKKPSWWEVACDKCDFVHAGAYTETEAIAAWNTRAIDPAVQELIDAYEDIMDYGIVFAKREQQDRLKAAKEKLANG